MIREKVEELRRLMEKHQIDAYIVPSTDPHCSEYVPDLWQRRAFISGFTGSAGDLVITQTQAGLWTDSRYFIQAENQLDTDCFTLFKMALPETPTMEDWIVKILKSGQKVGIDPKLISQKSFSDRGEKLEKNGAGVCSVEENLVDAVWTDRPGSPSDKVRIHPIQYSGESVKEKLTKVRKEMAKAGADAHVVSILDAISWLFNIRCSDVEFNPVAIAYALITPEKAILYIDENKINDDVVSHLGDEVTINSYNEFGSGLERMKEQGKKVWIDPGACNQWMNERLTPGATLILKESPITTFKATKNEAILKRVTEAHIRDGAAMVRFLIWIEQNSSSGMITEIKAANKLNELRAMGDLYQNPSFSSIVGWKDHGAIVHYSATPETDVTIQGDGILLVDSGGQYLDGTTDVTRTIAIGEPTAEQRNLFTRVLKGHICLDSQPFPKGTDGVQLDTLARMFLWRVGLDFGHGIGHGVGAYLSVHEYPPAISYVRGRGVKPEAGMICSNEPGYYKEGEFGLRFENVVAFEEAKDLGTEAAPFLKMKALTMVPIDLKLLDMDLISPDEIRWINDYHEKVRVNVGPLLNDEEKSWLQKATVKI